jgi:glycosyltransferase involved in cell wall biosynthesis
MKVSITIIAYNEEQYIKNCLESLTFQTRQPDEIILIAHNCTDNTVALAKKFPKVKVVELQGPAGIPYARQKSIEEASGEIILCGDGDSMYDPKWTEEMLKTLQTPNTVGVGGRVMLSGILGRWFSFDYFYLTPLTRPWRKFYFWGSSMGFLKKDFQTLKPITELVALKHTLGLQFYPDDLFMALQLMFRGEIRYAKQAKSKSHTKNLNLKAWLSRAKAQKTDYTKLTHYFSEDSQA